MSVYLVLSVKSLNLFLEVLLFILRLLVAGCAVYNLGTGKGTSVLEMVEAFEKASGKVSKSHLALIVERAVNAFTNVILDCVFSLYTG